MNREDFNVKFNRIFNRMEILTTECVKDVCISVDPDYDMDYGIDDQGNIVIDKESTFFPLSRLVDIKYRTDSTDKLYGAYMVFVFENNVRLYMYWGECYSVPGCKGRGLQIGWKDYLWEPYVSYRIINAMSRGWTGWWEKKSDFIIDDDILIAYIGEGGNVIIPDGVREIGYKAFRCSMANEVYVPDTLEEIDDMAFESNGGLREINLCNVKRIGNYAFKFTGIEHITLPDSLESIGIGAFEYSNIKSMDCIVNKSKLKVDSSIYMNRDMDEEEETDEEVLFERMNEEISERICEEAMIPYVNYYLMKIQNREIECEDLVINNENYSVVDEINDWVYLLSPCNLSDFLIMKKTDEGLSVIEDRLIRAFAKHELIQKVKSLSMPDTFRKSE